MREELIAYVLGELDEAECRCLEQALANDPALASQLDQIERCFADVESAPGLSRGLPRGLADRTAEQVLACCDSPEDSDGSLPSVGEGEGGAARHFSLIDMMAVVGVMITLGSLLVPVLYHRRNEAQRIACRENFRQLGQTMTLFAEGNGGFFPLVRPKEHAGIYSVRLVDSGFGRAGELPRNLVCAASPLAQELSDTGKELQIPTADQLARAQGALLMWFRRTSGGSYAYQVGWVKGDHYLPARNRVNCQIPVLADAPNVASQRNCGANHGGCLINVLFQDGSVRSLRNCVVPCANDHLFLNDDGEPAAGHQWYDAVVLPSPATPGVEEPLLGRFDIRF